MIVAPTPDQIDKANARIEGVARVMCEKLFLDPNELIYAPNGADRTPTENKYPATPLPSYQPPIVGAPLLVTSMGLHNEHMPRWRTFRREAALAIVAWQAVHHQVLINE